MKALNSVEFIQCFNFVFTTPGNYRVEFHILKQNSKQIMRVPTEFALIKVQPSLEKVGAIWPAEAD